MGKFLKATSFVGGLLSLATFVWGVVYRLIRWGGDVDFVISRTKEPEWVGDLLGFLLNPQAWALAVALLLGLVLLYLALYRIQPAIGTPNLGEDVKMS